MFAPARVHHFAARALDALKTRVENARDGRARVVRTACAGREAWRRVERRSGGDSLRTGRVPAAAAARP